MIVHPTPLRPGRATLIFVLAILLAAAAVAAIADGAARGPLPLDDRILLAFRRPGDLAVPVGPGLLLDAMRDLTSLGSVSVTLLVMAAGGVILLRLRRPAGALYLLAVIGGGTALVNALKLVVRRVRPDVVPHLTTQSTFSFPSSHAATAVLTYGALAVLVARARPELRAIAYVLAGGLAAVVGVSRLYLGVHFPSDVLAGWLTGLAWLLCCTLVLRAAEAPARSGSKA